MNFTIITIGKLKESYLRAGVAEYVKRLQPYSKVTIIELNEEHMPDHPSLAEKEQTLEREGERLLKQVRTTTYLIVLDVQGMPIASEELAAQFDQLGLSGQSDITFIIGGAFGLSPAVRQAAKKRVSFSRLTFTHQMVRLILVEQIYRAIKIQRREPYHW